MGLRGRYQLADRGRPARDSLGDWSRDSGTVSDIPTQTDGDYRRDCVTMNFIAV